VTSMMQGVLVEWASDWRNPSLWWVLSSRTRPSASREDATCFLDGVVMWDGVMVQVGMGVCTGHKMAQEAIVVYR